MSVPDVTAERICVCGHTQRSHSVNLGTATGCGRCWECQHFIDRDCVCGEINARNCPAHGGTDG